jgi:hypothetical protein
MPCVGDSLLKRLLVTGRKMYLKHIVNIPSWTIKFFFFFWISTRCPGQGLTNPGGAQALGKEFPASAPWLIHGLCPSLMAPWNCLHLARVELIKCSLFLVFCQVARLNKSCLEHTLTMGLWRTWTTHVPLDRLIQSCKWFLFFWHNITNIYTHTNYDSYVDF